MYVQFLHATYIPQESTQNWYLFTAIVTSLGVSSDWSIHSGSYTLKLLNNVSMLHSEHTSICGELLDTELCVIDKVTAW